MAENLVREEYVLNYEKEIFSENGDTEGQSDEVSIL
jgi:hypothetical protein